MVYRIPCQSSPWSYIGETGRSLKTRKSEHVRNVKNHKTGSNVAKHAWTYDHRIDFENAEVIDKGNFRTRKTLKSWHTALTTDADNNSCPLPGQYTVLIKKAVIVDNTHSYFIRNYANLSVYTIIDYSFIFHTLIPVEGYRLVAENL